MDDYQNGIKAGGITSTWVAEIERAQKEVFARIDNRLYPLDRSWLEWRPDSTWPKSCLPVDWDAVTPI